MFEYKNSIGVLHLPAIERENGDLEWWVNGKRHRDGVFLLLSGEV